MANAERRELVPPPHPSGQAPRRPRSAARKMNETQCGVAPESCEAAPRWLPNRLEIPMARPRRRLTRESARRPLRAPLSQGRGYAATCPEARGSVDLERRCNESFGCEELRIVRAGESQVEDPSEAQRVCSQACSHRPHGVIRGQPITP